MQVRQSIEGLSFPAPSSCPFLLFLEAGDHLECVPILPASTTNLKMSSRLRISSKCSLQNKRGLSGVPSRDSHKMKHFSLELHSGKEHVKILHRFRAKQISEYVS